MDFIHFNSIENILGINAKAIFKVDSSTVFKEDAEMITPVPVDEHLAYMPWGGDNLMPYNIINLIESDETLATCQLFNAEVCFGSGLVYDTSLIGGAALQGKEPSPILNEIDDWLLDNDHTIKGTVLLCCKPRDFGNLIFI